eukprot:14934196-Alexandrium_andersonii.AAC.1
MNRGCCLWPLDIRFGRARCAPPPMMPASKVHPRLRGFVKACQEDLAVIEQEWKQERERTLVPSRRTPVPKMMKRNLGPESEKRIQALMKVLDWAVKAKNLHESEPESVEVSEYGVDCMEPSMSEPEPQPKPNRFVAETGETCTGCSDSDDPGRDEGGTDSVLFGLIQRETHKENIANHGKNYKDIEGANTKEKKAKKEKKVKKEKKDKQEKKGKKDKKSKKEKKFKKAEHEKKHGLKVVEEVD